MASLNRPGTFELSKMGSFSCSNFGVLFLLLKRVPDPMTAFNSMLEMARAVK
ncbi:cell division protein ZipA C-terminal FtsZ-binding domain-containing protein [Coxiella-like endosymbiont of Rhipicephalus sanguineus]|uniref:cell division protein ZipA C-terminal FtsZ-binding domain-containing protein n=1 Tax=Coxiella-like endosymbiont of Rhipicephalus sanguineus TaxID=1955402 RepID=UPI002040DBE4|nr:cell division protein ZipA C-terminal FtsZ-binding domain-containing protein [Coxiella-like endosymbiont of Rhipicephalus sanguineus]